MLADMAQRCRIIFDTEEDVRLAIRLAATKADVSVSELLTALIRREFPDEIKDAKKYLPKDKKEDK